MKNKFETKSYQDLLSVGELIEYLCIPEVSNAQDYRNIVKHLKRVQALPRIHTCNKTSYPLKAGRDRSQKGNKSGY